MSTPEARFGALTALQAAAAPDEKQALAAATATLEGLDALKAFGVDCQPRSTNTSQSLDTGQSIARLEYRLNIHLWGREHKDWYAALARRASRRLGRRRP